MDEALRERERRAATGDDEARARWLGERLRAGRIDPERLRLAALLDDGAAAAASGGVEPWAAPADGSELRARVRHLAPWGKAAVVTAAAAAVRLLLPVWDRYNGGGPGLRDALAHVDAWLVCPCDPHAERAREMASGAITLQHPRARYARAVVLALQAAGAPLASGPFVARDPWYLLASRQARRDLLPELSAAGCEARIDELDGQEVLVLGEPADPGRAHEVLTRACGPALAADVLEHFAASAGRRAADAVATVHDRVLRADGIDTGSIWAAIRAEVVAWALR